MLCYVLYPVTDGASPYNNGLYKPGECPRANYRSGWRPPYRRYSLGAGYVSPGGGGGYGGGVGGGGYGVGYGYSGDVYWPDAGNSKFKFPRL